MKKKNSMPTNNKTESQIFGEFIREKRLGKKISLRKFAMDIELSPTFISKMEVGEYSPPKEENIIKMAEYLELDKDELLAMASKISSDIQLKIMEAPKLYASFLRRIDIKEMEKIIKQLK